MATSSIQAYGGSAMNGGVNINDVRKLIFYHNNEHTPFAVYDPINDDDDTAVSVEQVPENRLVPALNVQYNGDVLMCYGTPNPVRIWMPIVMCSEGSGGQGVDQFMAARLNAVGAFGTKGQCQLATEYDLANNKVKFQTKVGRFDNNPFVGDVLPRVIEQYTKAPYPKVLQTKSIDGRPYPICDFSLMARDYAELIPPAYDEEYDNPVIAWRRIYVDRDLTIKGFVIFDRFNSLSDGSVGAIYEVRGENQPVGLSGYGDWTETNIGQINPDSLCRTSIVDPLHSMVPSYYGHQFLLDDETLTLEPGKSYLFPAISRADNHNTNKGCQLVLYQHAWPVTPSTEKWGAAAYGTPARDYAGNFFKAPILQIILEDDTRIFI